MKGISKIASEMLKCLHQNIEVQCVDGDIVKGRCAYYTPPVDNDSNKADITVITQYDDYISISEDEIKKINIVRA